MRINRQLKAVAVFEVKRDEKLAFIDLKVIGLRYSGRKGVGRYSRCFHCLDELIRSLGVHSPLVSKDTIFYYKSRLVLCRMYVDHKGNVRYVTLASFQPGVLGEIADKLEDNFWRRVFFLEILRIRRPSVRA